MLTIDEIAPTILELSPALTRDGRRVALATYRLLADGAPVEVEQIAARSGLDSSRVQALLDSWPGVFRDQAERVVGLLGSHHRRAGTAPAPRQRRPPVGLVRLGHALPTGPTRPSRGHPIALAA